MGAGILYFQGFNRDRIQRTTARKVFYKQSRLFFIPLIMLGLITIDFSGYCQTLEQEVLSRIGASEGFAVDSTNSYFVFARDAKTTKWGIFNLENLDIPVVLMEFDSIKYYSNFESNGNEQFLFYKNGKVAYKDIDQNFDMNKLKFDFEEVVTRKATVKWDGRTEYLDLLYVRKGNLWGLNYMWKPISLVPCEFSSPDEVPQAYSNYITIEEIEAIRSITKSDYIINLKGGNSDTTLGYISLSDDYREYYQVRNPKTKLWGIYKFGKKIVKHLPSKYEEIEFRYLNDRYSVLLVKENGQWGMVDLNDRSQVHAFEYRAKEDVPLDYLTIEQRKIREVLLDDFHLNKVEFDKENEDGVLKARSIETGKCGLYQAITLKEIREIIPPKYDSIDFLNTNGAFAAVWNEGRVGIHTLPWWFDEGNQTVECLYNDYHIYRLKKADVGGYGTRTYLYLAVEKGGLWAWIDWTTGELKTEFLYDIERQKMPNPNFEQQY